MSGEKEDTSFKEGMPVVVQRYDWDDQSYVLKYGIIEGPGEYWSNHKTTFYKFNSFANTINVAKEDLIKLNDDDSKVIKEIEAAYKLAKEKGIYSNSEFKWKWLTQIQSEPYSSDSDSRQWVNHWNSKNYNIPEFLGGKVLPKWW